MTPLFKVEIPGRVGIKKNSKQIIKTSGRPFLISSKKFTAWERVASMHIYAKLHSFYAQYRFPLKEPMELEAEFYFKNHSGEADLSNCLSGPEDVLQKCGIILNDKLIYEIKAKKIFDGTERSILKLFTLTKQER